jgi:hypothetical protein
MRCWVCAYVRLFRSLVEKFGGVYKVKLLKKNEILKTNLLLKEENKYKMWVL